jgi:sugar phosphate isomerase/epimerase
MKNSRRTFLKQLGLGAASLGIAPAISQTAYAALNAKKPFFEISLAQFSLASEFFGGKMNTLDFPAKARNDFGINAVEYVSMFFRDKANDQTFLRELKQRTADSGVRNVLIMIDMEGPLADPDEAKRRQAVEDHYKWVDAAKFLGCHSVRVNLQGEGVPKRWQKPPLTATAAWWSTALKTKSG